VLRSTAGVKTPRDDLIIIVAMTITTVVATRAGATPTCRQ
jgi:hypothetical protein